jgi:hypothetical protein
VRVNSWKKSRRTYQQTSEDVSKVYDLVNCGPRQSFVVGLTKPFVVHNCSYGAGPGKIRESLGMQGIEISLGEAKQLHQGYWRLFAGVKQYGRWLEAQWERNGGWVLNGIGRPVCVAEDFKRDLVNRVVQSAGHDCFMLFAKVLAEELTKAGIQYKPFNWDLHDACYFLVPDGDVEKARHIVDVVVVKRVAEIVRGNVTLKWDANVCKTVADDKTESMSVKDLGVSS